MKNMKLKKLVVACQAAAMTMATSVAVSTQASDTELYKAPQTSQTTIMFMMDVSGSMNFCDNGVNTPAASLCTNNRKKRIEYLKSGMQKLLLGDTTAGIDPLPDNLWAGLSEFSTKTGRIKLQALRLDTPVTLSSRQLYRQVENLDQPVSCTTTATEDTKTNYERTATRDKTRTQTRTATQTQTVKQTRRGDNKRTRTKNLFGNWGSWGSWTTSNWSDWSVSEVVSSWTNYGKWSTPSSWSISDTNWDRDRDWSAWSYDAARVVGSSATWSGGGACSNLANNGSASLVSSAMQECTAWATDNTTCTTWEATNKTLAQITYQSSSSTLTTGATSGATTQQGTPTASVPITPTISWTPSTPTASSTNTTSDSSEDVVLTSALTGSATSVYSIPSPTDSNPPPATSGNTQTQTRTETQTQNATQTNTKTETTAQTKTQTGTQTASNVVTARRTRTDTTTATRADIQTTIYIGTFNTTHRYAMMDAVNALNPGGGTPTAFGYAEVGAYMMGQTTSGVTDSGFSANKTNISNATNYLNPASVTSTKQCNTQGIYFLTDGVPEYDNTASAQAIMRKTLNDNNFSCTNTYLGKKSSYYDGGTYQVTNWQCIGNYAKRLLDGGTNNPAGVPIKTAVVGFGDFMAGTVSNDSYNNDINDAKAWGELGGGGFYKGSDDRAVVDSVLAFLRKMQKYIPPVTTGSVTVPVDNLDTQNIQPWAYFPQFDPRPDAQVTTWVGNLKKYQVLNNILKDKDNANVMITDDDVSKGNKKGNSVDNPNDYWADQNITKVITKVEKDTNNKDIEKNYTVRVGGALSRLLLGSTTTTGADPVTTERTIFTDRKISLATDNTTYVANPINSGNLLKVATADLKTNNTSNNFSYDTKRGYLAALFGYNISKAMAASLTQATSTTFNDFLIQANAELRQMGAVMHSKPILITQKGTTKYDEDSKTISYDNRDDLIVFGTTQGVLHVVRAGKSATDSDAGKEVFSFVPSEMVDNQPLAFLKQDDGSAGTTLQYGIDGQWTAYTEYVTKAGTNTNEPVVKVADGGKQWLYGGLRMGGKSYYSLDLSDVTSDGGTPKLKFRINPTGTCSSTNGLGCMGQSWSKPTIAWVNWQGKRKLVMFVGGGYDSIYESSVNYTPSSTYIDQGAGVYMFDANDGSLLWWASANAGSTNTATNKTYAANMKRSVVSGIKAVDRNSDGLVDNLYFGDLGGQVWRVDLNASAKAGVTTDGEKFATRAVRILDMSSATTIPRFYSTPTFTIHNSTNGLFAAVTIGSGNLSYPMSAATNADDSVYVIYDKDVTRRNLSVLATTELYTQDVKPGGDTGKNLVKNTNGNTETALSNGGWYYPVGTQKRILNEPVAIDSDLYVSIFDSSKDITGVDCYGGVRGESNAAQFCLPYGACKKKNDDGSTSSDNRPNDIFLGKGNIGISFGGINRDRGIVLNLPTDENLKKYTGKTKFVSQRWYER